MRLRHSTATFRCLIGVRLPGFRSIAIAAASSDRNIASSGSIPGEERWIQGEEEPIPGKAIPRRAGEEAPSRSRSRLMSDLRSCAIAKDLVKGKDVHGGALRRGTFGGIYVENTVVDMYAKCSRMMDARRVFDAMQAHTVVSWNVLLMGYVDNGDPELALEMFLSGMDCEPDAWTLVVAIKACSSLAEKESCESWMRTTKPGKLEGGGSFSKKTSRGGDDFGTIITAFERGMSVHSRILRCGDVFISTSLVDMYAKCGSMDDAHRVFDLMPCHSVVSWNSLILGYVQRGDGGLALLVFTEMGQRGCDANALTYTAGIKACSCLAANEERKEVDGKVVKLKSLEKGKALHKQAAKAGYEFDLLLGSTLVDMYAKCGGLVDATRVFDRMKTKTVVSWNALLLGYAENGEDHLALELFSRMQSGGCEPDSRTYVAAVRACTGLAVKETGILVGGIAMKASSLEKVMTLHSRATENGCDRDAYVQNTLVDAYAKCGSMRDARAVFDRMLHHGVISWTALIMGYVEAGEEEISLELFERMKAEGGQPNARTFVAAVKACTGLALKEKGQKAEGRRKLVKLQSLDRGLQIHGAASDSHYDLDSFVASSLVNMYATCGSLADARSVFDKISRPDTVLWNVLMLGYVENGEAELALHFYSSVMEHTGCRPDTSTFVTALKACAWLANVKAARAVHRDIIRLQRLDRNGESFLNSLVDVYGKCGSMVEAQQAFDLIPKKDLLVGTWNALLAGFGRQGDAEQMFKAFHRMQDEGFKVDSITLNCILMGCSHAGLIERGQQFFQAMEHRFGIPPDLEHYTCMVDMLGRANRLTSALEVVLSIPSRGDPVIWMTVLTSCWKWKNLAVGRVAFEAVLQLGDNEKVDAAYNLMTNLYSSARSHDASALSHRHGHW